jgi:NADH:ubiquinone oxidoreductase subunit C
MEIEIILQTAAKLVEPWTKSTNTPESHRLDVVIESADLLPAVKTIMEAHWGYLITITGLDLGVDKNQLELLYHFANGAAIATLRITLPRENAVIDSLYSLIPSVSFYERELIEMLGITFVGTPNTDKLFLPDNWPMGVFPLRKDFNPDVLKS